ncbi:hypothetical protein QR680_005484 [Steinernema hermaphroditum]|uniref:Uncharacterized protein n=1 Tax=Steinernema hermaphroditum TaxID=289476 RepID=A0AA39LVF6_9BILA|nr:hypothetical protein QR680_005484 [Steinernema hermaphroditum]
MYKKSMVLNKNPKSRHPELCFSSRISSSSDDKLFNSVKPFDISKSIWVNHKPAESARYEDIPAQKPADPELTKALDNAWQNFLTDENGEPDENIVTVQFESTPMPHGFVPLDVDKFMEKRLLAVLNIDIEV